MRKIICLLFSLAMVVSLAVSANAFGNQQWFDTTYHFDYAIVDLLNGEVVEGKVSSWMDYENSDQVQVVIDGKTYYTHSSNVVLIDQ